MARIPRSRAVPSVPSSAIPPEGESVVSLPGLSSSCCGLVELVPLSESTRLLARCSKSTTLPVLYCC